MKQRSTEIRRCRPLLGTYVEIAACGGAAEGVNLAIDQAFATVEHVHRLMSFHEPASDVSRLNRHAANRAVRIDPWTYEVLLAAERLHDATSGAFDITVAPHLQRWGYLPESNREAGKSLATGQSAMELLPGQRVRFHQRVKIDLGGIAKGFAVDKAVEALQARGMLSGSVNAGGDLRVFGTSASVVHVRHPRAPGRILPIVKLTNAALATSATYFSRKKINGRLVSPLIDPTHNRPCCRNSSVSVRAATCLVADALTKVVMVLGKRSAAILDGFSASAIILTREARAIPVGGLR